MYKRQLLYSLLVALALPALLVANTWLHNQSFRAVLDKELQRKAVAVTDAFGPVALEEADQPELLQAKVKSLMKADPLIREVALYRLQPGKDQLVTVYSSDAQRQLVVLESPGTSLAWSQDQATAVLDSVGDERVWSVVSPLHDASGAKVALLSLKVSTADIDSLVAASYRQSILLLILSLLVMAWFLAIHFRLLGAARTSYVLRQADAMRLSFLSQLASSLQWPTSKVKNMADAWGKLAEGLAPEAASQVRDLSAQSGLILAHVRQLTRFAQIESGEVRPVRAPVKVASVLERVVADQASLAAAQGVTIERLPGDANLSVMTDEALLQEALTYLVGGFLSLAKQGTLAISYQAQGQYLEVHGLAEQLALPAGQYAQLVQEGHYGQEGDDTFAGLGVNVWLARRLASLLGGQLEISQSRRGGTAFRLLIPLL